MKKLTFPDYRTVEEINEGDHFVEMTDDQFDNLLKDLRIARRENADTYFDCLTKINSTREQEIPW